ncbi:cupin-like domain-containing protein [Hephaestia sp. GCM10023244]|uniref:cupin-like domain-containing protein n=1 Tax=unclassified Hephaestia TaxID=2631281 RepID=UPI0020774C92|nr:cupin-like domain-containing protein [Hephaestia sp. MAHUQ-44]MCM8730600.1 cupin-like domain-containing protein [Hephaestia sp. MAHUQ-44]
MSAAAVSTLAPLPERGAVDADTFAREIVPAHRPIVLRGQVAAWPAVTVGDTPRAIATYIVGFASDRPVEVMVGAPEIAGRFFYRDDMRSFNFQREAVPVPTLLAKLVALAETDQPAPALYAGAAAAADYLPGWAEAHPINLPTSDAVPRVWIGNATHVPTHYDVSSNLACVVAGTRRFTLFPPDQIANLYVGPLDVTMAGQPSSMVNLVAPDLARYPRFAEALTHAMTAELGPGDAIYIPSLWWHDVQAVGPFNVLVNYWWGNPEIPAFPALIHALVAMRDLPEAERAAWRGWLDHYVFGAEARHAADHLPPAARTVLDTPSPERAAYIRTYLLRALGGG